MFQQNPDSSSTICPLLFRIDNQSCIRYTQKHADFKLRHRLHYWISLMVNEKTTDTVNGPANLGSRYLLHEKLGAGGMGTVYWPYPLGLIQYENYTQSGGLMPQILDQVYYQHPRRSKASGIIDFTQRC
jgi:hypothetical protein